MLKYLLAVVAFLVLLATVLWGFPGVWALLTIVPGFILGATIAHVRRPREAPPVAVAPPVSPVVPPALPSPGGIRPGVVVLGGFFGLATAGASMVVAWAAAAPPTVVIEAELLVDASVERVWAEVGDPYRRTAWDWARPPSLPRLRRSEACARSAARCCIPGLPPRAAGRKPPTFGAPPSPEMECVHRPPRAGAAGAVRSPVRPAGLQCVARRRHARPATRQRRPWR